VDKLEFDNQNFTNTSVSAIIMMVFFYTDCPSYNTQLIECLMKLKKDITKDLFCVIAHGTVKARCPAVEILFQYWPELNPSAPDRKTLSEKHAVWTPLSCQHENCASSLSNEAVKMCMDHTIAIGSGDKPPPMLICIECADQIYKGKSRSTLVDILLPMEEISYTCINKSCKSSAAQKVAMSTCFSTECVNYNCNKPIRYCSLCDQTKHSSADGSQHIVHRIIPSPWKMDLETQSYFVEAIISLLKEAQPIVERPNKDGFIFGPSSVKTVGATTIPADESNGNMALEERQLLSRYGVWLITSLCTPTEDTKDEVLGRLLSILFQWFHYTACLPDDQAGSALERLKGECIHGWLMKVIKTHFLIFSSCLLPHPADYAKVGGHWDCWSSQTNQIKEGFKQLLCLVPYDIITAEVWSYIMPYWMECFRHEIPEEELAELKILLSKVLDPDLSPLGLNPEKMYEFISIRFNNTTSVVQEQALYWIQILTMLEVPVPRKLLIAMFEEGIKSMANKNRENEPFSQMTKVQTHPSFLSTERKKDAKNGSEFGSDNNKSPENTSNVVVNDDATNLSCYILMLDILVKQMDLQDVRAHIGLDSKEAAPILSILVNILNSTWYGTHTCEPTTTEEMNESQERECIQCLYCEMCALWYQLALLLIDYFCPLMEAPMIDIAFETPKPDSSKFDTKSDSEVTQSKESPASTAAGTGAGAAHREGLSLRKSEAKGMNQVKTAVHGQCEVMEDKIVDMVFEVNPSTRITSSALTDDDFSGVKYNITSAQLMNAENKSSKNVEGIVDQKLGGLFYCTSQGKFKFKIFELPMELQLLYTLLNKLKDQTDADILYHIVYMLKLMILHSEVLNKAAQHHRGFLIWCQESFLIFELWSLLQAEFSQISQLAVPALLHSISLLSGREVFLKVVEADFNNPDWTKRFMAVEKVTTIAHFIEPLVVKNSLSLQAALANAFCFLVQCLDDIEPTVAQRALLNLESIKISSLKHLVWCLEAQFDLIMMDRPIILQTIFQLYNHLSDRRFLTWDFFLARFDVLFLEAQIKLERMGEISYTRDLKNSNTKSELYQRKLTRAHEALSLTHVSRSLSLSFASKSIHKRSTSIPEENAVKQERIYQRHVSAPLPRRKSSKLTGSTLPEKFRHLPNNFFTENQLKEIAQEEIHIMHVVHKIVELDEQDRDTLHSLIFLLMQFLSRPDHSHPQEEKAMARNQQIVLRHLNILLGFSQIEKTFLISSSSLRNFPVFNAVITSMPKVLDFNFKMGSMLLSIFLPLLIYSPSHHKYNITSNHLPLYSIWLLQSHVRQSWLMSVFIIMYKVRSINN